MDPGMHVYATRKVPGGASVVAVVVVAQNHTDQPEPNPTMVCCRGCLPISETTILPALPPSDSLSSVWP